jgi:hypothetical protein
MSRGAPAGGWGLLVACLAALPASGCRSGAAPAASPFPGLEQIVAAGESTLLARRLPADLAAPGGPGGPGAGGDLLVAVVRMGDGHEELRVAGMEQGRWTVRHASRAGDEFRNLLFEDVNADGHPEIVSRWLGGQLDVVEVLARDTGGGWKPILQNAGQSVEERRRPDQSIGFWITSRTYEEGAGLPPVFETRVWRWDGSAFSEEAAP